MMLVLLLLVLCVPVQALAATYYLKPDTGLDTNSGTIGSPWKTIYKAKTTVNAGDTINILGGYYYQWQIAGEEGSPNWTDGHRLGTAGNPIILQANPGDTVTIDGQWANYFQYFTTIVTGSPALGHYIVVRNLNFVNYQGIVIGVAASCPNAECVPSPYATPAHHVAVLNSTFTNIENQQGGALTPGPSHHVIFKGNRVYNSGTATGGDGEFLSQQSIYCGDQSQYVVIEDNYSELTTGFNIQAWNWHGETNTSRNVIIRKNTLLNARSSNLIIAGSVIQNFYVYNNTFHTDATIAYPPLAAKTTDDAISFHNNGSYSNIHIKNNIAYGPYGFGVLWQDNDPVANGLNTLTMDYNHWTSTGGPYTGNEYTIRWVGNNWTLQEFKDNTPHDTNSLTGNPSFANAGQRDFTLQAGSTAIDAGTPALTTATNSGSSSTTLTVADAGYFHDGYGMIPGDSIRIGGAALVAVTAVNYDTNTLTLASARSWSSGAAVGLDYQGSAPDMGAIETVPTGAPPATYYVSKSGNNLNSCETAKTAGTTAKLTITAGAGCLSSGDTLLVGNGTYAEALNNVIPSGSASAPTVVRALSPLGAIVMPTSGSFVPVVRLEGRSHITFDGFVVDSTNSTDTGISTVGSNNIILQNLDVRNMVQVDAAVASAAGIKTGTDATFITIRNTTVHGIGRLGTPVANPSNHAIWCGGSSLLIENTTLYNNVGHGLLCYNPTGTTTTSTNVIRNNRIYGNDSRGMLVAAYGNNNQVYNNLVYSNWRGIQVGLGGSAGTGNLLYHNTLYSNAIGPGGGECLLLDGTGTARNNICYQNLTDTITGTGWTLSNNLAGTTPLFVDGPAGNFALQSSSAARNTGMTLAAVSTDFAGTGRPQEAASDIGAYEFVAGGGPQQGTYYVATTGNDLTPCTDAQSISTPKRSIASALPCLAAGSTLYLRGGTYPEQINAQTQGLPSGTSAGSPTIIAAYPGETVILAPPVSGSARVVELTPGMAYLVFQDLIVDGSGTAANGYLFDTTNHVRIQGGEVRNTVHALILMRGGTANEVLGTQVHTNTNEHCIYLNQGNSQTLIQGTTVADCSGAGIYAVADDYPSNSNTDAVIRANMVRLARAGATEAGIVVGHGSFPLVVNNIVYGNPVGIRVDDSTTAAKLINNTIYNNSGAGIQIDSGAATTEVTNNIVYQNGTTIVNAGTGTVQTTNLTTDPSFENAGTGNFHLTAGSAARNAGTNSPSAPQDFAGTTRPKETSTDIGAYEFDAADRAMTLPARMTSGFFAR